MKQKWVIEKESNMKFVLQGEARVLLKRMRMKQKTRVDCN